MYITVLSTKVIICESIILPRPIIQYFLAAVASKMFSGSHLLPPFACLCCKHIINKNQYKHGELLLIYKFVLCGN